SHNWTLLSGKMIHAFPLVTAQVLSDENTSRKLIVTVSPTWAVLGLTAMSPARPVPQAWAGALVGSNNSETKLSKAQRKAEADNGILVGRGLHMVFILQWVGLLTV